jgi:hypothetical protein
MTTKSSRRLVTIAALLAVLTLTTACNATWGIRQSYRNYITGPIANGSITVSDGATWLDGSGTGKGPFQWPLESSTFNASTEQGTVQFTGRVATVGHQTTGGYTLDTTFSRPRLVINGDVGTLSFDLVYRPFEGFGGGSLPPLQSATNVAFASLDLSSQTWVLDSNGFYNIANAPATGINSGMELIGWDDFYGPSPALDPFSAKFTP